MTKIEELIESIRGKQTDGWLVHRDFQDFDIEEIMKQYAEWYAKKTIDSICENLDWVDNCPIAYRSDIYYLRHYVTTKDDIINSKLPEHA